MSNVEHMSENSVTSSGGCPVASLNFIDLQGNTGPSVNELEFNRWLFEAEPQALLLTPMPTPRLNAERVIAFGRYSLKSPIRAFGLQQHTVAKRLAHELAPGAILYYRHTRLANAALKLKRMRPDIRLAAVRMSPAHSDVLIAKPGVQRLIAQMIETINSRIISRLGQIAEWVDCVTPRQAELLSAELGKPVHVVMNGVNTAIFAPLSEGRRAQLRQRLDIPDGAIVVGYCGGSPMQRGAVEIAGLVRHDPRIFGVVIGRVNKEDRAALQHERMRVLGELPYEDIPELVASFDVAVALDTLGRSDIVGNSNQKVRQALACGTWVMTQAADLPFDAMPVLGCNLPARDPETLSRVITEAGPDLPRRQERAAFARVHLDTATIFARRHQMLAARGSDI